MQPSPADVGHQHGEHPREHDAREDARDQHGSAKHASSRCVLRLHALRGVHHAQGAEMSGKRGLKSNLNTEIKQN